MEIKSLKPNLDRIANLLQIQKGHSFRKADSRTSATSPNLAPETRAIYKLWDSIENNEIPYEIKDNAGIRALIEEYQLQSFQNDFFFLAFNFIRWKEAVKGFDERLNQISERQSELLYAFRFLFNHNLRDIKIDLKHTSKKESASIKNELLLNEIRKALLEYFVKNDRSFMAVDPNNETLLNKIRKLLLDYFPENDSFFMAVDPNPETIDDWGKLFKDLVSEKEKHTTPRGRKNKNIQIGRMVDSLQKYLQEYTEIKAEGKVSISNQQGAFIFSFLNRINIIIPEDDFYHDKEYIRNILNRYRKLRKAK